VLHGLVARHRKPTIAELRAAELEGGGLPCSLRHLPPRLTALTTSLTARANRDRYSPPMEIRKPPAPLIVPDGARVLFLAGSIEMGTAVDWQASLAAELGDRDLVVLNPRRDEWDSSWRQSIDEPRFRGQVEWELDGLDRADVIAMWFAPDTRAPITLLELGLHARGGKLVVGCPDGYWRKGNVEVLCARHSIPLAGDWPSFVAAVTRALDR
jgi:hypothetical protein